MGLHLREFSGSAPVIEPALAAPKIAARAARGRMAQISGAFAEDGVLASYRKSGYELLERRWRGKAGEIDLILRQGTCFVFVEVKQSVSHAAAAERLGPAQMRRICRAACEFCEEQPDGQLSEMRFDAALVDGVGRIDIIENAFGG